MRTLIGFLVTSMVCLLVGLSGVAQEKPSETDPEKAKSPKILAQWYRTADSKEPRTGPTGKGGIQLESPSVYDSLKKRPEFKDHLAFPLVANTAIAWSYRVGVIRSIRELTFCNFGLWEVNDEPAQKHAELRLLKTLKCDSIDWKKQMVVVAVETGIARTTYYRTIASRC